jgi:hypothetical protein
VTRDKFEAFYLAVYAAAEEALKEATGRPGIVSTRFTPDGLAPKEGAERWAPLWRLLRMPPEAAPESTGESWREAKAPR